MQTDTKTRQPKTKVFVVDDHPIVREHLMKIVSEQPDLVCCGTADTVPGALAGIYETKPDLAIIDLRLGVLNGLNIIKQLKDTMPNLKMLVFSFFDESLYGERVINAGARGFVNKGASMQEIKEAIRTVLAGELAISQTLKDKIKSSPLNTLTDRELEVLQLLGEGKSSREVAGILGLSIKTIEVHRDKLKQKLGRKDAAELIHFAINWVNEQRAK
jgi:DNA-binding NarL/FixJ family response regulator